MCMNPPIVYEETYPSNQKTIKITAIVSSIFYFSLYCEPGDYPIVQKPAGQYT
jgi:hypothetical protein